MRQIFITIIIILLKSIQHYHECEYTNIIAIFTCSHLLSWVVQLINVTVFSLSLFVFFQYLLTWGFKIFYFEALWRATFSSFLNIHFGLSICMLDKYKDWLFIWFVRMGYFLFFDLYLYMWRKCKDCSFLWFERMGFLLFASISNKCCIFWFLFWWFCLQVWYFLPIWDGTVADNCISLIDICFFFHIYLVRMVFGLF